VTATKPTPAQDAQAAWVAATEKTSAAGDALNAAEAAVPRAEQDLADAEHHVADVLAAAINDGAGASRSEIGKARTAVEKCRSDVEWAGLQAKAAETAYQRAIDAELAARQAVITGEYRAEAERWADPDKRETVALKQLTELVAELIELIADREQLHARLIQEVAHFPEDKKLELRGHALSGGRPSWYAPLNLMLRSEEIRDAIEAGIGMAKAAEVERDRARRFG
jgi:hypothetical protein